MGPAATFQVRVASIATIVDAAGPDMNLAETVTLLNDMVLLAPSTLVDADITWQELDQATVRATWIHAGNTVSADLIFADSGALLDFVSYDRARPEDLETLGVEGFEPGRATGSPNRLAWSTPIGGWKDMSGRKLPTDTVVIWRLPTGDFVYGDFDIAEIVYNGADSLPADGGSRA